MIVEPLTWNRVRELWPVLAPHARLMEQREPDDWPVQYTIEEAASGRLLLWAIHNGADCFALMATSVDVKPSGRRFGHICWVAGRDHTLWERAAETAALAHFRERNCAEALTQARRGWQRHVPEGWTPRGTIYRKALRNG